MDVGIIGLPYAGKTTIFNVLTAAVGPASKRKEGEALNLGVVLVPDRRLEYLASVIKPKKTTPARIHYADAPVKRHAAGFDVAPEVMKADALAIVVRAFENDAVVHPGGEVDALRDYKTIQAELILTDAALVERRLEGIRKLASRGVCDKKEEAAVLEKCLTILEAEKPLRGEVWEDSALKVIKTYPFLTIKPVIVIVNIGETDVQRGGSRAFRAVRDYCAATPLTVAEEIAGKLEEEILGLEAGERSQYMAALGIAELGADAIARLSYRLLDLVSFFTYGPDECKAWTIRRGTRAREAAGKIHSDMERGFIRAEVIAFADFEAAGGSLARVKEAGRFRLEGKDYVVQDGDLFIVRFQI